MVIWLIAVQSTLYTVQVYIARLISVFLLTTTNKTTCFDLKFLSKYQALRTNPKIIFKKDLYKAKFDASLIVIEF